MAILLEKWFCREKRASGPRQSPPLASQGQFGDNREILPRSAGNARRAASAANSCSNRKRFIGQCSSGW